MTRKYKFYRRFHPRRRREGRTDYRLRLKLVKSGKPRLIVRRSNRYILVQLVESKKGGDVTLLTVSSKELSKYGWKAGTKNIPASYLTGFLAAKLALKKGVEEAIADIGLHRAVKGSRVFAAIKGALDGGLQINIGDGVAPSEERIRGEHISEYFKQIADSEGRIQFSKHDPKVLEDLPAHFEEVKERIEKAGE